MHHKRVWSIVIVKQTGALSALSNEGAFVALFVFMCYNGTMDKENIKYTKTTESPEEKELGQYGYFDEDDSRGLGLTGRGLEGTETPDEIEDGPIQPSTPEEIIKRVKENDYDRKNPEARHLHSVMNGLTDQEIIEFYEKNKEKCSTLSNACYDLALSKIEDKYNDGLGYYRGISQRTDGDGRDFTSDDYLNNSEARASVNDNEGAMGDVSDDSETETLSHEGEDEEAKIILSDQEKESRKILYARLDDEFDKQRMYNPKLSWEDFLRNNKYDPSYFDGI